MTKYEIETIQYFTTKGVLGVLLFILCPPVIGGIWAALTVGADRYSPPGTTGYVVLTIVGMLYTASIPMMLIGRSQQHKVRLVGKA